MRDGTRQGRLPNLVLVTTDQQRFDTVAPYAPSFVRMPHFDFLAREGVRFDRAYTDVPVCVASRVGLLTGQTFLEHGMLRNGESSSVMGYEETLPGRLARLAADEPQAARRWPGAGWDRISHPRCRSS